MRKKKLIKLLKFYKETRYLISDAGTPAISDPGMILIQNCIKKYKYISIPVLQQSVRQFQ